jgi:uncharacterized protein (TIGR01370 family)
MNYLLGLGNAPRVRRWISTATLGAMVLVLLLQVAAVPPSSAQAAASPSSWVYQLTNYKNGKLDELAANKFDMAVIDLARDGGSNYFTSAEVGALRASGKSVFAYFSIGSIETYRPEASSVPASIKLGTVSGWPSESYVKYWDGLWWPVVQGRIDQALKAGFNGAYLDMIVTYEEIPAGAAGTNRKDLAGKMVDLIARVSTYAKSKDPSFKVIPQNSPELYTWPKYLPAIDGLGIENAYYIKTGSPCNKSWCTENRNNALAILKAGKMVMSTDYTSTASEITNAYQQARVVGFLPYVSTINLDNCYQSGVSPLTKCSATPAATTVPAGPTSTATPTKPAPTATVAPTKPAGTATVAPTKPAGTATVAPTSAPTKAPTATATATKPAATATPVPPAPTAAPTSVPSSWGNVKTWVYQLSSYKNGTLDQLTANTFDVAVIDLARDGNSDYFTSAEIKAMQTSGKRVLAYFSVGSIEDYRPEWSQVPASLKLGAVAGWPQEQYVKYWDAQWWPIVQGRIDQAINAGFDGAYLDMIVTYEEIAANAAGTTRADLASKMVDLIAHVSQYAKGRNPNFKVLPQNSPELYTYAKYLPAIDGIGAENLYYIQAGQACSASWCAENRNNAAAIRNAGKLILSVDYTNKAAEITNAYTQAAAAGNVEYVSLINLDTCYLPGISPLALCK